LTPQIRSRTEYVKPNVACLTLHLTKILIGRLFHDLKQFVYNLVVAFGPPYIMLALPLFTQLCTDFTSMTKAPVFIDGGVQ